MNKLVLQVLDTLAGTADEPTATLASDLKAAVSINSSDIGGAGYLEMRQRISILATKIASNDLPPTAVIKALLKIDEELARSGATTSPLATQLGPLAAERMQHATLEQEREETSRALSERSPIFYYDKKNVLFATPVSPLGEGGLAHFIDRILATVLRHPPKRVILVLEGLTPDEQDASLWNELEKDLAAQKIGLKNSAQFSFY
jgi:hypothetical protein